MQNISDCSHDCCKTDHCDCDHANPGEGAIGNDCNHREPPQVSSIFKLFISKFTTNELRIVDRITRPPEVEGKLIKAKVICMLIRI